MSPKTQTQRADVDKSREALASQREKLAHVGRLSTMGEMTASIAHEIRNPLGIIKGSAELLERKFSGSDDARSDDRTSCRRSPMTFASRWPTASW